MVKTTLTFVWLLVLIDYLGRRNLLMIGAAGGAFCMYFIAAYIKIAGTANVDTTKTEGIHLTPGGTAAIFFFYLWTAFYTPSWNGTPWVIASEISEARYRSLGQTNAAANNWLWNFLVARFTEQAFQKLVGRFLSLYLVAAIFGNFFRGVLDAQSPHHQTRRHPTPTFLVF